MTLGMAPRSFELQGGGSRAGRQWRTAVLQDDKERRFHRRPPGALQSVLQEDCSRTNGSDRLLVGLVLVAVASVHARCDRWDPCTSAMSCAHGVWKTGCAVEGRAVEEGRREAGGVVVGWRRQDSRAGRRGGVAVTAVGIGWSRTRGRVRLPSSAFVCLRLRSSSFVRVCCVCVGLSQSALGIRMSRVNALRASKGRGLHVDGTFTHWRGALSFWRCRVDARQVRSGLLLLGRQSQAGWMVGSIRSLGSTAAA
jgi:hypothetical protein